MVFGRPLSSVMQIRPASESQRDESSTKQEAKREQLVSSKPPLAVARTAMLRLLQRVESAAPGVVLD